MVPLAAAVAKSLAIRTNIEIKGTGVREEGGSRVEVGTLDVDGWGEGDVLAPAV